jgi:hypothetical protein
MIDLFSGEVKGTKELSASEGGRPDRERIQVHLRDRGIMLRAKNMLPEFPRSAKQMDMGRKQTRRYHLHPVQQLSASYSHKV